ncbi:MAG: hypothetical protein A2Y79_00590 [Deltaproteobacteria bacterium RBG_13_43_22]|nr:MAG: hypothetical protein A2Y79_00590 [Deltaproteobacteria bacterium RBG_13_43_22]
MAYSLTSIFFHFKKEVEELNRIVLGLSSQPASLERDTHIEGCFIRLVVSWEVFSEEYFLRCLCVGKTRSGYEIKPLITSQRNKNDAFKKINATRRERDKEYLDWLDSALVKQRINDFFRANSRVQKLIDSPDKLFEIRIIRNAIAHRSTSAINKFEKFVKDQLGYLYSLNPTMADLLIMKKRGATKIIFLLLSDYFLGLSERLTK